MFKYVLQQFCLINSSNRYQLSSISRKLRSVWPVDSCHQKSEHEKLLRFHFIILDQLILFRHVRPEMPASQLQRNGRKLLWRIKRKKDDSTEVNGKYGRRYALRQTIFSL